MGPGDYGTAFLELENVGGVGGMQDDLMPMSAFLGSYLGESQAMNGFWNMEFSQSASFQHV
jgi:hypothetical protein